MKKKAHDDYDFNFITLKSADQFVPAATVNIIGDKVFIETEDESIMLSAEQAKTLSYFINDRLVRVVDLGEIGSVDDY
jgi:hypothetical protein